MANVFKNAAAAGVGTTATTIYTSPTLTTATIIGLTIANVHTAPVYVNVIATINSTDYYLIKAAAVPLGGSLVPIGGDQKVVLKAADSIKISSSAASSVDVVLSALEIT